MNDYPAAITAVNHVEPVPRRIRAFLAGEKVLDTTGALYVWEWPYYPQYYIPVADIRRDLLTPDGRTQQSRRGTFEAHTLRAGQLQRPGAARLLTGSPVPGLADTVRFDWAALDAWFEEDEQVFVHPRNPYVRVDALRSTRPVRVELDGVVLAESPAPVMVFETGLPTRYYINPTEINYDLLIPTDTVTSCPYKGTTSQYWSVAANDTVHPDLAWAYDPARARALAADGHLVIKADRPKKARRRGGKPAELDAIRAARQARHQDPHRHRQHPQGPHPHRPEDLRAQFRGRPTTSQVRAALAPWPRPGQPLSEQHLREAPRQLARQITDLDAALKTSRKNLRGLVRAWMPALLAEPGIGPVSAAQLLVTWSHPGRFRTEAAFAALTGTAPIPASSGRTDRHRSLPPMCRHSWIMRRAPSMNVSFRSGSPREIPD